MPVRAERLRFCGARARSPNVSTFLACWSLRLKCARESLADVERSDAPYEIESKNPRVPVAVVDDDDDALCGGCEAVAAAAAAAAATGATAATRSF